MRKLYLALGLMTALSAPTLSHAATVCEQHQADRKTTGTVLGALAGALVGNAVSSHGGKTGGTIIGAGAGAVVGNQIARQNNACPEGYDARDVRDDRRDDRRDNDYTDRNANGESWRDDEGRVCRWRERRVYDDYGHRSYRWVQVCR